jgi:putative transposase
MKRRFTEEEIVKILREAEASGKNSEVIRKYGISPWTFYAWKRKYHGMEVTKIRKLRQLESENGKLKQLVAEQALALQTMQEYLKKRGLL